MTETPLAAGVRIRGLTKSYGPVRAVAGIDLDLVAGETVALLGPNGAGKSTTVDLLLGLATPDAGTVSVFGRAPAEATRAGLVGAMLQSGGLITEVSVRELVALAASLYPAPLPVDEVLALADLTELAGRRTTALSGGQAQRVRYALALVPDPDLLVLDEPIAGERQAGWTRQLRLTPLSGRSYLLAKAGTGFLVAVPALVLVYAVGALAEHVRLPASEWALAAGSTLLALTPFVALGIWLGHQLTVDVLGPLSGALFTVLGLLGGVWVPIDQLPHGLQDVARALPAYWLSQAGRAPLAGSWVGWTGVGVLAAWTVAFALLAARAYRRDTARA